MFQYTFQVTDFTCSCVLIVIGTLLVFFLMMMMLMMIVKCSKKPTGLASFCQSVEKTVFSMEKTVPEKILFARWKKPPGKNSFCHVEKIVSHCLLMNICNHIVKQYATKQAISPFHLLGYILHPAYRGANLSSEPA